MRENRENNKETFLRKRETTEYIYIPGSKYGEAKGNLKLISCLEDTAIHSAPRIGKLINKLELYNQCSPSRLNYTNIREIENSFCVRTVMNITPVLNIERQPWGDKSIPIKVNDGVYIC